MPKPTCAAHPRPWCARRGRSPATSETSATLQALTHTATSQTHNLPELEHGLVERRRRFAIKLQLLGKQTIQPLLKPIVVVANLRG